jgi:small subunit ribosomal protein S17
MADEEKTDETIEETPVEQTPAEEPAAEAETPAVEEAPAEEPAAEAPAAKEPVAEAETPEPEEGRRTRTPAAERKPISREEKPEHDRGRRQERRGVVVSDAMDKTIVVKVDSIRSHPKYKKVIRRSIKFHAHDEQNSAHVGDVVRIVETRPLSKTKHWRLAEIVEVAK